jgi:hypothetical protein
MLALLALDAVNSAGASADIPGMVWDLIFWLFIRGVLAFIAFWVVFGLFALLAALTDKGVFAGIGVFLGWVAAVVVALWGLWHAFMSLIVLVTALGWFQ